MNSRLSLVHVFVGRRNAKGVNVLKLQRNASLIVYAEENVTMHNLVMLSIYNYFWWYFIMKLFYLVYLCEYFILNTLSVLVSGTTFGSLGSLLSNIVFSLFFIVMIINYSWQWCQFYLIFSSMGCAIFQLGIWTIFWAIFNLKCFSWHIWGTFDILSFSWIINEEGVNIKNFILFLSYKVISGIWNNFKVKRTNFK